MTELLRADNHELFTHVRLMAVARAPVLSWEEIAANVGLNADEVPALLAWFLSYRLPPGPKSRPLPDNMAMPRDPTERAEYLRLMGREESLLTLVSEAPRQLVTVQTRMAEMEHPKRTRGYVFHG